MWPGDGAGLSRGIVERSDSLESWLEGEYCRAQTGIESNRHDPLIQIYPDSL